MQNKYIDFLERIKGNTQGGPFSELAPTTSTKYCHGCVVLMTPPLHFTQSEIDLIAKLLKCTQIKYEWKEKAELQGTPLCVVQMGIKISNSFRKNAILVFAGYNETGKTRCLRRLSELHKIKHKTKGVPADICSYINTKDYAKRIDNLFVQMEKTMEFVSSEYPEYFFDAQDYSAEDITRYALEILNRLILPIAPPPVTERMIEQTRSKYTFVIIPMGIPGLGKSWLIENCKASLPSEWSFFVVSSDAIRRECMQEYMTKAKKFDQNTAFEKTAKPARKRFFEVLKKNLDSTNQIHILFLDKNHPVDAMNGMFQTVADAKISNREIKLILLAPLSAPYIIETSEGTISYPFSLSLLFQCMIRVKNRTEHDTLLGDITKKSAVVIMMYNLYKRRKLDLIQRSFDHTIQVPFTDESVVPDEYFTEQIENELKRLPVGKLPNVHSIENLTRYISEMQGVGQSDPAPAFLEQLINTVSSLTNPSEPYEEEKLPKKKRKLFKRLPVYIGIDLEDSLKGIVIPLIYNCLEHLVSLYPDYPDIRSDFEELKESLTLEYSKGSPVSDSWNFPNSLHVTTLFIGGDSLKLETPYFNEFQESVLCSITITHLAYIPKKIICSNVEIHQGPPCSNKIPHCTLLLSGFKAKMSNEVLNAVKLLSEPNCEVIDIKSQLTVFTYPCQPNINLQGITTLYY